MEVKISEMVSGVLKYLDENEEMIVDKTEFGYPATSLTDLVAEVLPDVAERTIAEAERGKREGSLTNADLDNFYNMVAPTVDGFKRKKLKEVISKLKEI